MNNPLLSKFETSFESIPFGRISAEHFLPAIKYSIKEALAEVDDIAESAESPTFTNTIVALEYAGRQLERILNIFYPLLSAHTSDEMMDISLEVDPLLSDYSTAVSLNEKLWRRIRAVYESGDKLTLSPEKRTLLEETYLGFARSGALLEGDDREEYRKLKAEISELTTRFGQNVLKELNGYEIWLDEDDLGGLPQWLVEQATEAASERGRDGKYLFTLDQPVYTAFMKYSTRRDLREHFYRLYTGRNQSGEYDNTHIILSLTQKRLQLANLLGFETFAHYKLAHTMARTPERVFGLLDTLRDAYMPAVRRELDELRRFASDSDYPIDDLRLWDYSFYASRHKEALYAYNDEDYRPYFELSRVVGGVFGLANKLYGINIVEAEDVEVYHPDVKAYKVTDADGTYLGLLYADFFPRSSKRPGAWMTEFRGQCHLPTGEDCRPHISIVMNFTKPTATLPSLLTPQEVSTLLHEFGHALHGLLSNVTFPSLAGTNVYRDFVELPSQINENFLTRREFLNMFARHYKTGEPIPDCLIQRLIATRQYGAAYAGARQLGFGYLDMAWHSVKEEVKGHEQFENSAISAVQIFPPIQGSLISPQFSHIFSGGYAAGYYSYKWAEVLDADAFELFEDNGVFNSGVANSFRKNILEKGGSEAPDILYTRFRGDTPNPDALLRRDGLI